MTMKTSENTAPAFFNSELYGDESQLHAPAALVPNKTALGT